MFGIFKTYSDVKKGIKDPTALGADLALDAIKGPMVIFTILAVLFFAALILVAYTGLLGGPYLFFKIVFWILFLPAFFISAVVWMFIGNVKKMMEKAREEMKKDSNVIDVEVE